MLLVLRDILMAGKTYELTPFYVPLYYIIINVVVVVVVIIIN